MGTTRSTHHPARPARRRHRPGAILLAAAGLATVLLASAACDTAEQVPWASYTEGLQQRIDDAAVTGSCAALRVLLTDAQTTSHAHEKATGFPNDALVSYIQAAQARAGCPAGTG
jgi:hypothetical protein